MTLNEIKKLLTDAGIDPQDAAHEARLLISHFAGVSFSAILADRDRDYSDEALIAAVQRRAERYPLQYLLGEWEFMSLPIKVSEDCLIPRPDSEVIASRAVELMPEGAAYLDLCTGSGCIAAAVMHFARAVVREGYAIELYPETAALARENFSALGVDCTLILGDVTDEVLPHEISGAKFDVITANPPYVTAEEMTGLEPELSAEPRCALTDGGNGLYIIEKIIEIYKNALTERGVLLIEHGSAQGDDVRLIGEKNGMKYTPLYDIEGRVRAAELRF